MKILITHPEFEDPGGVANYWRQLEGLFVTSTVHFTVGKRIAEKGLISRILRSLADYWNFARALRTMNVDLVHLNPSLDPKAFVRDGIFALLARINGKKTVVFFHGWQTKFEKRLGRGFVWVFKLLFGKSEAFLVLSSQFKETLERWGVTKPIYLEVTVISQDVLAGFDMQNTFRKRQNSAERHILFLSRMVAAKGIYETIEAVALLQAKHPEVRLIIAGDGDETENVKSYVSKRNIPNITFAGYVRNAEKRHILEKSHIFCFPSHYGEGLPTCVVEAMAFGLPVVTRPVGGLADFFKNGEHGFMSESLDPATHADMIEKLLLDNDLYKRISLSNYQHAQSHFLALNAVERLERIYEIALGGKAAATPGPHGQTESARHAMTDIHTNVASKPRILITHPEFEDPGGVSNYWKSLQEMFTVSTVHFTVGKRVTEKGTLRRIRRLWADYWRFVGLMRKSNIDLVQFNPSLDPKSFVRDGTFVLLARLCGKKTVVFFHGWQKKFELRISRGFSWMFKFFFGKVDAFVVLSDPFKDQLEKWGVTKPIYREVTVLRRDSLEGFDIHKTLQKRHESGKWQILFLSRILKTKGVYETVQAVSLLQTKYPNLELVVAGEGDELDNVKSFARDVGVSNVVFPGYVRGEQKRRLFEEADIFCLPSYSEGFPVAVVEAMAFGLPVVTRPVGGLVDFFKDGEHGFMVDSLDPDVVAGTIEKLLLEKDLYDRISLSNYQYAQHHFSASDAAARLEKIYSAVLGANCDIALS